MPYEYSLNNLSPDEQWVMIEYLRENKYYPSEKIGKEAEILYYEGVGVWCTQMNTKTIFHHFNVDYKPIEDTSEGRNRYKFRAPIRSKDSEGRKQKWLYSPSYKPSPLPKDYDEEKAKYRAREALREKVAKHYISEFGDIGQKEIKILSTTEQKWPFKKVVDEYYAKAIRDGKKKPSTLANLKSGMDTYYRHSNMMTNIKNDARLKSVKSFKDWIDVIRKSERPDDTAIKNWYRKVNTLDLDKLSKQQIVNYLFEYYMMLPCEKPLENIPFCLLDEADIYGILEDYYKLRNIVFFGFYYNDGAKINIEIEGSHKPEDIMLEAKDRFKKFRYQIEALYDFIDQKNDKHLSPNFDIESLKKKIRKEQEEYSNIKKFVFDREKKDYLFHDEVEKLFEYIDTKEEKNCINLAIKLNCYLGMRVGELCALKKEDIYVQRIIDRESKKPLKNGDYIYVHNTMHRVYVDGRQKYVVSPSTKTSSGNRFIPIGKESDSSEIKKLIDELFAINPNSEYLISHKWRGEETPFCITDIQTKFNALCAKAGINVTGTHAMRRTVANKLRDLGYSNEYIISVLGHASINTTEASYYRNNVQLEEAIKALNTI